MCFNNLLPVYNTNASRFMGHQDTLNIDTAQYGENSAPSAADKHLLLAKTHQITILPHRTFEIILFILLQLYLLTIMFRLHLLRTQSHACLY